MLTLLAFFAFVIGMLTLLARLEKPQMNGGRYSGKVYDPQVTRRPVGAVGKNRTGRLCWDCGSTTFGLSDRCGRCDSVIVGVRS